MKTPSIAHTPNNEGQSHSLVNHLQSVAELASAFMPNESYKELAYYTGLWSDIGKFDPWWQQAMRAIIEGKRSYIGIPHTHQGANLALNYNAIASLCILGHHNGLANWSEFKAWISNPDRTDGQVVRCRTSIRLAQRNIDKLVPSSSLPEPSNPLEWDFLARIVFSVLIDADYTDTSRHYGYEEPEVKPMDWGQYSDLIKKKRRSRIRDNFFLACRRAEQLGSERIVYIMPRIAETQGIAEWAREIFGNELVAHQRVNLQEGINIDRMGLSRLLAQNWREKVIVTTETQLLTTLFSNQPEDCRKLHNLANSLLAFHNPDFLPKRFEAATSDMLDSLKRHYGCHIIRFHLEKSTIGTRLGFHKFDWEDLLADIKSQEIEQTVIICPCPKAAGTGYQYFDQLMPGCCYYISERMCASHRHRVIGQVKAALRKSERCYLITTDIIYGNNLKFPHGYQVMGPLSYIQEAQQLCDKDLTIFQLAGFQPPDVDYNIGARELYILFRQGKDLGRGYNELVDQYHENLNRISDKDLEKIQELRQQHLFRLIASKARIGHPTNFAFVPQNQAALAVLEALEARSSWNKSDYNAIAPYLVGLPPKIKGNETRRTTQGLLVWMGKYDKKIGLVEDLVLPVE